MRANERVGFIGGAGHSGSTLLGLLLGSHPRVFYAGEAKKTSYLGDPSKPLRKRSCKICGVDCPVWGRFVPAAQPHLYEQISQRTGRPIVIDSTKNTRWIEKRADEARRAKSAVGLVFLIRDGRAVVNSRVRKYPDRSLEEHVERWRAQMEATEALLASFDGPTIRVRYEALATEPLATVRSVCEALELPFEPSMLDFAEREHHPLGGNNGTQHLASRGTAKLAGLTDRTRDYYGTHPTGIVLDERWRTELPAAALQTFERLAGAENARFCQSASAASGVRS